MKQTIVKINLDTIGVFRKAEPKDIYDGSIVFLVGDGAVLHRQQVLEVRDPQDDFKAFVADDGCRYGLDGLYVLLSNSDLQTKVNDLKYTIDKIKEILS
jgi:hypothetical protein